VESLEKKRVEFLMSAKKCKRVRKSVKGKEIGKKTLAGWNVGGLKMPLPHIFETI
jgi:hypothetical protein